MLPLQYFRTFRFIQTESKSSVEKNVCADNIKYLHRYQGI